MPEAHPEHPSASDLADFGLGKLPRDSADAVATHLAACEDCQRRLAEQQPDSFIARLRAARPVGGPSTPLVRGDPGADTTRPPGGEADRAPAGYEVLGELGRGGMGVVYKARQRGLNRVVALKMILSGAHAGPDETARFRAEAEAIARLHHPGIVQVYDFGTHGGLPYFSLELCEGGSLADKLDGTPLPPREAAEVVGRVAEAVEAAHRAGVVHRDLKPANVLLSSAAAPKISDFGLAKRVEGGGMTQTGAVVGTPSYMAPEQAEGKKDVGPAADVYALGAILYECLTGRPPFRAATAYETLLQVVGDEPVPVRRLQPGVPADLETICHKCLQKEPARRYPTAGELADDLSRWREGRPIVARPVGRAERLWRWCRREPVVSGLLVAVLAALAAGTATSAALAARANRKATEAQENAEWAAREAEAARENEREAARERNVAVAVNDFLRTSLLGQADIGNQPFLRDGGGRDPNITVAELLDRAAREIDTRFHDQPQTEAALRLTIGEAYRALGKFEPALRHLERSLALQEKGLGADHPNTLDCKDALGVLCQDMGQHARAEELLGDVVRRWDARGMLDDPQALASRRSLASLYLDRGKYTQAEALLLEVITRWERLVGADHAETLQSKNHLALVYHLQGKPGQAEVLYLELLRQRKASQGADHPHTLINLGNLAVLYQQQGKLDQAERLFLEMLPSQEARLGPGHPHTLYTKHNLAEVYRMQQKLGQAEKLLVEVLRGREKLGVDPSMTLSTRNNLAVVYRAQGKLDQAEPLFREVAGQVEKKLGPAHPNTLLSKSNLAGMYRARGKLDQAEPLFREVLQQQEKQAPGQLNTLIMKNNLAQLYKDQKRYDKAELLLEQAVAAATQQPGFAHPATQRFVANLRDLYERWGKPEKAESVLRQQLEALRGKTEDDPAPAGALADLGDNLLKQRKYAESERLLRDSLRLREKAQPELWTTFQTRSLLGGALLGQNRYPEAEALLVQGYEGLKKRQAEVPPADRAARLKEALDRLVALYDATGKKDEAARYRRELDALSRAAKPSK